jgi:hypothetical protein
MREWNLLPGGVALAPEDRAPGLVQRRQIAIALLQPAPKTAQADLPPGARRIVIAKLIVRLPAHHRRVLPIARGHRGRDAPRVRAIDLRGRLVVPPRAKLPHPSFAIDRQDLRVRRHQPGRRRRCRRTEHHLQPLRRQHLDRRIEPFPIKYLQLRLDHRPGKLRQPHITQPQRTHLPRIPWPPLSRPLFRVEADAQGEIGTGVEEVRQGISNQRWPNPAGSE